MNTLKRPIAVLAVLSGIGMLGATSPGPGFERLAHAAYAAANAGLGTAANTTGAAAGPSNEDWG